MNKKRYIVPIFKPQMLKNVNLLCGSDGNSISLTDSADPDSFDRDDEGYIQAEAKSSYGRFSNLW